MTNGEDVAMALLAETVSIFKSILAGAGKEKVACPREALVQRARIGKTRRKRICPPQGERTNIGDIIPLVKAGKIAFRFESKTYKHKRSKGRRTKNRPHWKEYVR